MKDRKFMKEVIKDNPEWVDRFNGLNKQETKELEYFQKIQVLKQENSALKVELGKTAAEVAHLNHILTEKLTTEFLHRYIYKVTKKNYKVKYAKLMNEYIILRDKEQSK